MEFQAFVRKVDTEGFRYAYENYVPQFADSAELKAAAAVESRMLGMYRQNQHLVERWWDLMGGEAVDLHNSHIDEVRRRRDDACLWSILCTDGYVIPAGSEEGRTSWLKRMLDLSGPHGRTPAALLERAVPGGAWTRSPLPTPS
ncbi:hypothetical protein [Kitasatospora phosalacinea]|uniref:Uncharacterized protein n=1 Tax=Kitasatospora phosalacinea TaxID=2065 RepID=A0ABW6GX44_9ACTN